MHTAAQPPQAINLQIEGDVLGQVVINTGTITNTVQVAQIVTSVHQLRAPLGDFVGREAEQAALLAALEPRAAVAAIACVSGMGGLGKTELALTVAHALRDHYPDAQIYVSMRGSLGQHARTPADGLRSVIQAFDPHCTLPDDLDALAARYRGLLGGKRALLVLDDVADSVSVRPFLPPAGCALLVTARARLTLDGQGTTIDLALLGREESRALLLDDAPHLRGSQSLEPILHYCGDVPLAVRVAGATLANNPPLSAERYVAQIADARRRAGALRYEDTDVYAVLGLSDDLLAATDPLVSRRWRMLGVCTAPFEGEVAGIIWGEADADARDALLGQLVRRSLLRYDAATQQYRLHDLLRDVASARRSPDDDSAAHLRYASYYLAVYREAQQRYAAGPDSRETGLRLFDAAWPHIRAAAAWIMANPSPEADQRCVYEYGPPSILDIRMLPRQLAAWGATVVAAAQRLGDARAEATALIGQGNGHLLAGELAQADVCYARSLALFRALNDHHGEAHALIFQGETWQQLGRYGDAEQVFRRALALAEAQNGAYAKARSHCGLGYVLAYTSSYDEARRWLELARAEFKRLGDEQGLSRALEYLGYTHTRQNNYAAAQACASEQLRIATRHNDQIAICTALNTLGIAYWYQGDLARGLKFLQRQLKLATAIGYLRGVCFANGDIAGIYAAQENIPRALEYLGRALAIADQSGDQTTMSAVLDNMGRMYARYGDYSSAMQCFSRALHICIQIGEWAASYFVFADIGLSLEGMGRDADAERLYKHAIELMRVLDVTVERAEPLCSLAAMLVWQKRYAEARELVNEALALLPADDMGPMRFRAQVLDIRVRAALGSIGRATALAELAALVEHWPDDRARATVYYETWQLKPNNGEAQHAAAKLYKQLYVQSPNDEYRRLYKRLTADDLPVLPPLPHITLPNLEARDIGVLLDQAIEKSSRVIVQSRSV